MNTQVEPGSNWERQTNPRGEPTLRGRGMGLLAQGEKRAAITVLQAARLLGKSRDTVYRWLNEGRLAGRRVGGAWLVYRDSLEDEWSAGLVEKRKRKRL